MGCLCVWSIARAQSIKPNEQVIYKPQSVMSRDLPSVHTQAQPTLVQTTHSIRSETKISEEILRQRLQSWNSPLSDYSQKISDSPYSSTILAICYIEQYRCSKAPNFNFWGLGPGIRYNSYEEGIDAIIAFLSKAEAKGRTTIESFRGWYCQSACTTWYPTVIKIKTELENIPQ